MSVPYKMRGAPSDHFGSQRFSLSLVIFSHVGFPKTYCQTKILRSLLKVLGSLNCDWRRLSRATENCS